MTSRRMAAVRRLSLLCAAGVMAAGCGQDLTEDVATARAGASVDLVLFQDGRGAVTTASFSTAAANEVLLAFVASDGPAAGAQSVQVSGAGLSWTRVARANAQAGTSEIWRATAPAPLAGATVTSTPTYPGYDQSLTVVFLSGATGVGSVATASARSGAPAVSLVSAGAGSWVFAVGNDWDSAAARTLPPSQTMVHEWRDTAVGDDFWVQRLTTPTAAAGAPVTMNATAPTADRWNLAAVEVLTGTAVPTVTPAPTFSPAPGVYSAAIAVTLADAVPGATIHYTTDGSAPTTSSPVYGAPVQVRTTTTIQAIAVAPGLAPSVVAGGQYGISSVQLNGHPVVLDAGGKLLSWLPQDTAYAEVNDRIWTSLTRLGSLFRLYPYVLPGNHGVPSWPNAPGSTIGMLAEAAAYGYPFTGDPAVMAHLTTFLDHFLAYGRTPPSATWSDVFYNEGEPGSSTYAGAGSFGSGVGDGAGVLEPDKLAEIGYAFLIGYEWSGASAYRDAAIRCADQLVAHRRTVTGASVSPWPFRVRASNGAVVEGYTANVLPAVKLFDELVRAGLGSVASYRTARDAAWTWMMTYPMVNDVWTQYFEDVGVMTDYRTNRNQLIPGNVVRYVLEDPSRDPQWQAHAQHVIAWIESSFGEPSVYGATPISEQYTYMYPMASHTSRYGAVCALYASLTGDAAYAEKAFRALNWSTYMSRTDGDMVDGYPSPNQIWMTDGFGDPARHFYAAMAALPQWAPPAEDHLLRSSSVVQSVTYAPGQVTYRTFHAAAGEVLRLTFVPSAVLADGVPLPQRSDLLQQGWTYDPALRVLRVRHDAGRTIAVQGGGAALAISPVTASTPPRGSVAFSASGGSGSGRTWSLSVNASGGAIGASTGAYAAGPTGGVTDVVRVVDSLGNQATRAVSVTAGVSISPVAAVTAPRGTVQLAAAGGSGTGYSWTLAVNASGASIGAASGTYTAGTTGGVTDVVRVVDSLGNEATRSISVTAAAPTLVISPASASAPPRGSLAFSASGGSGAGYAWSFAVNASGGTLGASGDYRAGPTGGVRDVVQVVDSLGNRATRDVSVGPGVSLAPASAAAAPGGSVQFTASGGSGSGWTWSLSTNASGGSVGAGGLYRAGPVAGVTDTVRVSDGLGNAATAAVSVTGAPALAVDRTVSVDGRGAVTTAAFATRAANELLLAFVSSDGPLGAAQTATVSGAGLTWTRVVRANAQAGVSEIWKATAPAPLASATVTSAPGYAGYDQSLTVVCLTGAAGTGRVAAASAPSGAPAVTLPSSAAGAWAFAVGNDWDRAIARTLPPTQALVHEWRDTAAGDDFWVQRLATPVSAAGVSILMNVTAPTADRWNLAAVEVVPR
jgi:hypothetical protein